MYVGNNKIDIYNAAGILLKTEYFDGSQMKTDVQDLSAGLYFAKISTSVNFSKIVKFVKL